MRKNFIVIICFLLSGCLTTSLLDSNNENINVTYLVRNTSNQNEWTVIIYKDVLGDVEEELYMKPGETWEKTINFKLSEYGSEYLSIAAHSLNGTFDTTIKINDINQSVSSGSRIKSSGREYFSLSQLHIDRDTIKKYKSSSSNSEITVTYLVKNTSNKFEWAVIIYKNVLGDVEEELYMKPNGTWEKEIKFRLSEYGSEHLSIAAHSLNGTLETTITINEINQSVRSGSRIKSSGNEYLSLSQLHIDRDTIKKYK
jgi:ribosomal protein L18E